MPLMQLIYLIKILLLATYWKIMALEGILSTYNEELPWVTMTVWMSIQVPSHRMGQLCPVLSCWDYPAWTDSGQPMTGGMLSFCSTIGHGKSKWASYWNDAERQGAVPSLSVHAHLVLKASGELPNKFMQVTPTNKLLRVSLLIDLHIFKGLSHWVLTYVHSVIFLWNPFVYILVCA